MTNSILIQCNIKIIVILYILIVFFHDLSHGRHGGNIIILGAGGYGGWGGYGGGGGGTPTVIKTNGHHRHGKNIIIIGGHGGGGGGHYHETSYVPIYTHGYGGYGGGGGHGGGYGGYGGGYGGWRR